MGRWWKEFNACSLVAAVNYFSGRHRPRRRAIQYVAAVIARTTNFTAYWIPRIRGE
jgi:hypothetical protein